MLFALLFGTALVLIRTALPEGAEPGAQWLTPGGTNLKTAAMIMPFAGIAFLWFIGVVRDGFGRFEDKFFSTVFIGSGLLFLAMMFVAAGVGAGLEASSRIACDVSAHAEVATFGQMVLLAIDQDLRAADGGRVHDLAGHHLAEDGSDAALASHRDLPCGAGLLFASDISMWLTLAFPIWVLVVSVLLLARAGVIDLRPRRLIDDPQSL